MALADYELRAGPEHGGNANEQTVTYKYRVPIATWHSLLPSFNATKSDADLGTVYFVSYRKRKDPEDGEQLLLDLTYSDSSARNSISFKQDGDNIYLPNATIFEKPIETAANYLTKWNYDLYQHRRGSGDNTLDATPAWYNSATDTSNADGEQWKWAKSSPGDEWILQEVRTKPGQETYYYPLFRVQYHYWHATKATVEAQLKTLAKRDTPAETFGYSTGEWLVTAVNVAEDGRKYRGTVEWTHADEWDNDIYEAAT